MRRLLGSLVLFGLFTTGCSDDTAVLLRDISDHVTHDLLGTLLGVSDPAEGARSAPQPALDTVSLAAPVVTVTETTSEE